MTIWAALPWLLALPLAAILLRPPRRLNPASGESSDLPFVSIVVPARNEAVNITTCLESLAAQNYPGFEIIVVDDRSDDRTADLAGRVPTGSAERITVLQGAELPDGWFGKPWACIQGARAATADLLLFTDADTRHAPDLLERSVRALHESEADLLSLVGLQVMASFWEGVIQPQVFILLATRYPDARGLYDPYLAGPERWRQAIANGQYILIRRAAYDAVGGHEAVRGEVVEDLRLAQELVRSGGRLAVRDAVGSLQTRMYRSLGEIVEGWSKNIWTASLQVYDGTAGRLAFWSGAGALVLTWIVPPAALALGALGLLDGGWTEWAAAATAGSLMFWGAVTWRLGGAPWYALGYPFGAAATVFILIRSWRRGSTISWKGRVYTRDAAGVE